MDAARITIEKFNEMFSAGKRFDSRGLLDYRPLKISYDVSNKAEGSARVYLGKTEVIVGVKLQLGAPYPDSLDKGNLMVSTDLLPLASPRFEQGPPKFPAIELPRLVDRAIRESGMIELSKLVVTPKEKVWTVIIDIYPINDDGNLVDASTIAAIAALKKTKIPVLDKEGNIDYYTESKTPLPLSKETSPISMTFYKLGDNILMDATREEEEICDIKVIFGMSIWNGKHMINSAQKSGGGNSIFTQAELEKIMDILPKKFDELNERVKKLL